MGKQANYYFLLYHKRTRPLYKNYDAYILKNIVSTGILSFLKRERERDFVIVSGRSTFLTAQRFMAVSESFMTVSERFMAVSERFMTVSERFRTFHNRF
jgi:hypothetical protein